MRILVALLLAIAALPAAAQNSNRACLVTDVRPVEARVGRFAVTMMCEGGRYSAAAFDEGGIAQGAMVCRGSRACTEDLTIIKDRRAAKGDVFLCQDAGMYPLSWHCTLER